MFHDTEIVWNQIVKLGNSEILVPRNWFTNIDPSGRNNETSDKLAFAVIGRPLDKECGERYLAEFTRGE